MMFAGLLGPDCSSWQGRTGPRKKSQAHQCSVRGPSVFLHMSSARELRGTCWSESTLSIRPMSPCAEPVAVGARRRPARWVPMARDVPNDGIYFTHSKAASRPDPSPSITACLWSESALRLARSESVRSDPSLPSAGSTSGSLGDQHPYVPATVTSGCRLHYH
jgi:hypothetical protein